MKIAFLIGNFPSPSETFILNQIVGLIDRGHQVDIYASNPRVDCKIHPDIKNYNLLNRTHYYPNTPQNYFLRLLKAFKLLFPISTKKMSIAFSALNIYKYGKQAASLRLFYASIPFLDQDTQYDVIHCHFGMNGVCGMLLKDLGVINGKLCTVFHGFDLSAYLKEAGHHVYDRLFEKGDLFLPISEYWKQRLIEMGCDQNKIIVHHMGIDCNHFAYIPRRPHISGQIRLVTVARLVEKKGVEYAIRAIAQLKEKYPNIQYKIVGNGPLRTSLEHLAEKLSIQNMICFMGWQNRDEVIKILDESDLLVLPSVTTDEGDQEGIPVALMEAMAIGLPVLSTQHSGIPELVEDGVSGLLTPERNVEALAENIRNLIIQPDCWQSLGHQGRIKVESQFDIFKLNDQLTKIFQQN